MSEELKADDARQQAELAQLRAELAAAEARAALAKAEAELAAAKLRGGDGAPPNPASTSTPVAREVAIPPATSNVTKEPIATASVPPASPEDNDDLPGGGFSMGRMFRMSAAFGSSMVVHLLLLLLLGLCMLPQIIKEKLPELLATVPLPQDQPQERLKDPDPPHDQLTTSDPLSNPSTPGSASSLAVSTQIKMPSPDVISPTGTVPTVAVPWPDFSGPFVAQTIAMGKLPGQMTSVVDTPSQALDIITNEIRTKLEDGKVLVLWCFDESESMKDDRAEIRQRIDVVYRELGLIGADRGDALTTGVVSYGKAPKLHTTVPTSNLDQIMAAMDAVTNDPSGLERQCQAIGRTLEHFQPIAQRERRQMMLILVSDESGDPLDNNSNVELVIHVAKEAGCPIYVIGREAVFGYPWAHMNWNVTVPAKGGGTVTRHFVVQVDRGPETPLVEALQTDGFGKRRDAHASGFGPYEQVRMAHETGGIFFMLPSPEANVFRRDNRKYAIEQLRIYAPDLTARTDYQAERDKYPLRRTIAQVIQDLNPWDDERAKSIEMRMRFSPDPTTFVKQIRIEQAKSRQYIQYLDEAEKALRGMVRERELETSPRWQASYDLMLAQLLAYKVRMYEYGAYLEAFIKTPKLADAPTAHRALDEWIIMTRKPMLTGELTAAAVEESTRRFQEVIKKHSGTPWASRAADELKRGFGIDLKAHYDDPNRPPQPQPEKPIVRPVL